MRKAMLLIAAVFCLLLAGCGAGNADDNDTPGNIPAASVQTPASSEGAAADNTAFRLRPGAWRGLAE